MTRRQQRRSPDRLLRGRPLVRSWVVAVTVAEFVGFAVPAVVGALTAEAPGGVTVPAVLAAGAVEGAMLGAGQAVVLRAALPALPRRRWVAVTSAGAVVAYLIGLLPSTFASAWQGWPPVVAFAVGLPLGAVLLASIGTAQWFVLRRHVRRAGRWIAATAAAWVAGLGLFLGFAMPLWRPGQPLAVVVGIGLAGGLLMAAATSVVTGFALAHLLGGYRDRVASPLVGGTSLRPAPGTPHIPDNSRAAALGRCSRVTQRRC